ncbi:hypothetical protein BRADI_3g00636v3 [Brachypodium distachyon]|uniref:F-box domain-containing protein n=1 Tax=Brachypodium distachyon TaxID=15368 RepID=A0A0Q3HH22_BRADI|nr:hypothetical protein BRADI_3g00636v3 [Brachypodium distachyon]
MAAASPRRRDRLSDLPDDLLIHILSYAPVREAASTAALSRRWRRRLWLQTSAINFDHRSYPAMTAAGVRGRAEIDTRQALAFHRHFSHKSATRKVTVVMRDAAATAMHDDILRAATFPCGCFSIHGEEDGVVEELRVDCGSGGGRDPSASSYALSLDSLPFGAAALRILDLKGCNVVSHKTYSWAPGHHGHGGRLVAFPSLEALRLRRCGISLDAVQAMLDAAPKLADLCIESCTLQGGTTTTMVNGAVCLCCPPATVSVVLAELDTTGSGSCASFFLDAPGLRRLRFTRVDPTASAAVVFLQSRGSDPPMLLQRVHLEVHHAKPLSAVDLLGLRHTRALKLTVYSTADLLDADADAGQSTPSVTFPDLERLEIEELTTCGSAASRAAAVVSLLRRCPAVQELRLRSRWRDYLRDAVPDQEVRAAAMADLSGGRHDQDDEADCCEDLGEFGCTGLDSLRRVAVDLDAEELSYFHARLLRFLAQNAAHLEEVVVGAGGNSGFDSSRIDRKVAVWMMMQGSASRSHCPPPTLVEYSSCSCCGTAGGSSSWAPAPECPVWPPFLIEFPPLEAPDLPNQPCSDGEDDDDDISPRHFMDVARKRGKEWSSPECFSLKLPKAK